MSSLVFRFAIAASAVALSLATQPIAAADPGPCGVTASRNSADTAACALAAKLESDFVYPEQGARYAAMLRANVAAGRYASLTGETAAQAMTRDLQALQADGHLQVHWTDPAAVSSGTDQPRGPDEKFSFIEQPGWIAPGIAYIRINAFPHDQATTDQVAAFMRDHAGAKALIFDVRTHHGGGLDQMDAIFPWLFEKPTPLLTMATRRTVDEALGGPSKGKPTMKDLSKSDTEVFRQHWALPNGDTRLLGAKVYVLTSGASVSAAEHFALAMKRTHRAVLVGAPTGGANHFGGDFDLPGGFHAFVPVGRTFDPDTGKDWEGTGVIPDEVIAPQVALEWTLAQLGVSGAEARQLAESRRPAAPMERENLKG
jgi:hypothetical protein